MMETKEIIEMFKEMAGGCVKMVAEAKCLACTDTEVKIAARELRKFAESKLQLIRSMQQTAERSNLKLDIRFHEVVNRASEVCVMADQIAAAPFNHFHLTPPKVPGVKTYSDCQETVNKYSPFTSAYNTYEFAFKDVKYQRLGKIRELFRIFMSYADKTIDLMSDASKIKSFDETKTFHEVKTISISNSGGKKMGKTMRIFKEGKWQEVPVEGEELAEKIKLFMKQNSGVSYIDAAIHCEKEMEEGQSDTKNFSEAQVFQDKNDSVPASVVQEFAQMPKKAGGSQTSADGAWFRDARGKISPTTHDDGEDVAKFTGDPKFAAGKRFSSSNKEPKTVGFSEDQSTYTDRDGQVLSTDNSDAEQVEVFGFQLQFEDAMKFIHFKERDQVARKAIQVLKTAGILPMKATNSQTSYAIQVATSSEEKFDASLRYLRSGAFQSFEKSIVAALA